MKKGDPLVITVPSVSSGPPVYPTREPAVGVSKIRFKWLDAESSILSNVSPNLLRTPSLLVKGPTLGENPLMVTFSEIIAPVPLLITIVPPMVHGDGEHRAGKLGVRLA